MKNILTTIVIAGIGCTITACSSFLDEEPKSKLTNVDYYKTEAQAQANVNYLYRNGAIQCYTDFSHWNISTFASIPEELTGYFSNSSEGQEFICKYSRELTRQSNTMILSSTMDNIWDNCYKGINVANGAIKHIPEIAMDESTANRLIAEAKFFRAFNYFYLVKTFGDVPFYTEPYEAAENMELPRTETSTIYAQIEKDLNEAIEVLPAAKFTENGFRITKYAAAMALTDVYMYEHKYSEAANTIRIVINSGHSLATNDDMYLNSAYNKLRTMDDLDETIYSFEFDATITSSGNLTTYSFDGTANNLFSTYVTSARTHGPLDRYLNVYKKNDLRIQPNQFFHWEYTNPNTGAKWSSELAGCWYYFDEEAMLSTGKGTKDWNIYRYAEALLDAAESIAQSEGVTSEAVNYLAQVQARANMEGKSVDQIAQELQSLSKDAFIQTCWTERLREMPLEFKMWDMCIRTGMFPDISETTPGEVSYVPLVGATNASGATFKESDLLWPISVNEIQRNPNLTQNPGYSNQ